jgi:hypothetical protein
MGDIVPERPLPHDSVWMGDTAHHPVGMIPGGTDQGRTRDKWADKLERTIATGADARRVMEVTIWDDTVEEACTSVPRNGPSCEERR